MKTLKRSVQVAMGAGLLVLSLGMFREAQAGTSDTMTMTVTPGTPLYAVKITSPEVQGYDFTTVAIGGTTISTKAIAVKNNGNISEFFSVGVVDVTPTFNWTNNGASLTAGTTSYAMQGLFVATGAGQPASASFTGASNNVPAAPPATGSGTDGQGATQTLPLSSKDLYLQLLMPTGVQETGAHTLTLTINGQSS